MNSDYPVRFDVDYPEEGLDRLTTFFRIFMAIPIVIVIDLLSGGFGGYNTDAYHLGAAFAGFVVLPALLMILFRAKYPRWWFDWNLELARFHARINAYLSLLRDEYPSTDEQQAVHLEIDYPNVENDLSQGMPLVKWFLAIPHYVILAVLAIVGFLGVIVAWFAILFTGRYPKGIFDFIVGIHRWALRVAGYAFLMVTDKYPPFSLEP
jgi:hypothetical protein